VEFHRNGELTKGVNSTFIALIPKVDSPQRLADFRPISLFGSMYKVLAKVLANRIYRGTYRYNLLYRIYFFKKNWGGCEVSKKIAWIKWDSVCLPMSRGGLGVRRLGEFNLSLLDKWCWRMLVDKDGLWYRVLKAQYGEVGGRLQEGGRHSSRWVIGNGRNTLFWRVSCS
jgi:hypothetical protein